MTAVDDSVQISNRKLEHLHLALRDDVEDRSRSPWFDVSLVHQALPGIDLNQVDLASGFLGFALRAPIWITGMTGGHDEAATINARLARAAERHGIAMGLGSQRAGLADARLMESYRIARTAAPAAVLVANIGTPQLLPQGDKPALTLDEIRSIIDSVEAQALAIHLNYLQELVQPEGDRNARGAVDAIRDVVESVNVPVLAKETGAGVSRESAAQLVAAGVAAIDVAGRGGTSMVKIERARSARRDPLGVGDLDAFGDWGISTPAAILESRNCGVPLVATGGVRTGVDAARAIALGADTVGVGLPFLLAAAAGEPELDAAISQFVLELRGALFLTGSRRPEELKARGAVLSGDLLNWKNQRGL